ncbi:hypothetical protein [Mycolicibacterium sphagni]|uniref:hypothetical protein n=1 Tax=Mycolicibacterium sphagni TaxID=1786 RepID=UPI0021F35000|nr:hypothetical protein [Mycolicibacterium sphagni]MCV7174857.1 hypothetical protein [Mycolicibacterium sphagni]
MLDDHVLMHYRHNISDPAVPYEICLLSGTLSSAGFRKLMADLDDNLVLRAYTHFGAPRRRGYQLGSPELREHVREVVERAMFAKNHPVHEGLLRTTGLSVPARVVPRGLDRLWPS